MNSSPDFRGFPKISRLTRNIVITEKIDGTNAQIVITEDGDMFIGSRKRWITPENDNFGFARWVEGNKSDLLMLGPGQHFGEWWGQSIQRKYGLDHKRFSLFNTHRWLDNSIRPECCYVVPVLYQGLYDDWAIQRALNDLKFYGSLAAPLFMKPEGIVIWHEHARVYFKKTIENDEIPKYLKNKGS